MEKEQIGKNLYFHLIKQQENEKIYKLKLRNKTKMLIQIVDNNITFCKTKNKKYLNYFIPWLIFHPEVKIDNLTNIILSKKHLNLIKDKCTPNFLLYQALQIGNQNLIKLALKNGAKDYDDVILSCCNCKFSILRLVLNNKKYLIEKIIVRAIFFNNFELVSRQISKIKHLEKLAYLAKELEHQKIFNIIIKQLVKNKNLNKKLKKS